MGFFRSAPLWHSIENCSNFVLSPQPTNLERATLWKIIIDILTEPTPRQKLDHINSLDDVVELLRGSKNIIVLTGAGVCKIINYNITVTAIDK